jgi:hypothetical protein
MGVARIMEKYRHKPFSFSSSSWYSAGLISLLKIWDFFHECEKT